jgi:hypothetical protein
MNTCKSGHEFMKGSKCNHGIGKFKDKIEVLEKAIKYLKQV